MAEILIIDDDASLAGMLAQYLLREGFHTALAHDGENGIQLAKGQPWDVIILDIMLPGMNGIEVLRNLRTSSAVPVLMLTAKGHDDDRVLGLETGADDYISKPFNPRELVARLNALIRRSTFGYQSPSGGLIVGDLKLDLKMRKAHWKEATLPLTAIEFRILEAMLRSKDPIKSRDQLSELVNGRPLQPFGRGVDVHISNLRKKIAAACKGQLEIEAVRGQGYRIRVSE